MLNQCVIVGRLTSDIEKIEDKEGKNQSVITLAVSRPYKNSDGIYETDFIKCLLWNNIAENTAEYCHKGDIIGVKGRLQSEKTADGYIMNLVAEKVTFLSTKKNDEVEDGRKEED